MQNASHSQLNQEAAWFAWGKITALRESEMVWPDDWTASSPTDSFIWWVEKSDVSSMYGIYAWIQPASKMITEKWIDSSTASKGEIVVL